MKRRFATLCVLIATLGTLPVQNLSAEGLWYGNLDYDVMDVSINDRSYYPQILSASVGRWLVRGVGLELQLGAGVKSDSNNGVEIDISGIQGFYLRWQSPSRSGLSAYFLTGFSRLQLDGSVATSSSYPGTEWFDGPAVGVGLHGKLLSSRHWGATLGYKHYFLEDELTTDSVNMGLRYDF